MRPAARVQAAIELLDTIIVAARDKGAPADRIIADYFKQRRYAGSKDRRAVRGLVYDAIRLCGKMPGSGRSAVLALAQGDPDLREHFDGSEHGPAPIADDEQAAAIAPVPQWLDERLRKSGLKDAEIAGLLGRAQLDLRVNTLKATRETLELPEAGEPLLAEQGLRFPAGTQIEQWPQWRDGQVEIQDHGSQWACAAVAAQPGETVIDLCAGAGGKTLALAAAMENRGSLVASDTDKRRLGNLAPRAAKAGAGPIETLLLDPGREAEGLNDWLGKADAVLVDAPCSGTGTLRRNPEARWRLTPAELKRLMALQTRLLDIAASLVKPGGRLIYVTCSLLDAEGKDQIDAFLGRNEGWAAQPADLPIGRPHGEGMRLTPSHDGTDGFFIARIASAC